MRLWQVGIDVWTKDGDEEPKQNRRSLLVMAEDDDIAEGLALAEVTKPFFGQRVIGVEWRSTSSRPSVVDLSESADSQKKEHA